MIRKIIKIEEELCNGCGLCANACHENAITIIDGKAKLIRDDYCDGLGNCLPVCPTGAISFEEREALAYDDEAVQENIRKMKEQEAKTNAETPKAAMPFSGGCPGSRAQAIARASTSQVAASVAQSNETMVSELMQWPVQIKLVPARAPYFENANLLVAADCTAFAYANFHKEFIRNHITLIGCPKLDDGDYSEKLTDIIRNNNIKSVKVVRMEVPCCGGIEHAVVQALKNSGKMIPWQVVTISCDGNILQD
ncbi:MAG TPA: 4Fe-4S binding protein [Lachnospiraceae bacterium]|nr:4Fe-4S binding protein [Lachnospiraceae bacterium]